MIYHVLHDMHVVLVIFAFVIIVEFLVTKLNVYLGLTYSFKSLLWMEALMGVLYADVIIIISSVAPRVYILSNST